MATGPLDQLSVLYLEGMEFVINCLLNRRITHYFVESLNILGDSCRVQKEQARSFSGKT